jgi:nitrite reductase (NO-forming)
VQIRMTRTMLAAVAFVVFASLLAAPFARPATAVKRKKTTTVTVVAKEFSFKLSRKSAPSGVVTFKVTNKGKLMHDFKIAGKKTPLIKPGKSATLKVTLKKHKYRYVCTVPGHAAAGMKGTFTVK